MLRPLTIIGCMTVAGAVWAEPVPLTSETLKETLSGSLLEMDTPLGTKIPVRFAKNGLVSGEAGILASMLGAEKDRGRWWVKNDELCVKWFRWFEAKPKCASLSQDGTRIYWRERSGESGTATLAERAEPAPSATVAAVETQPQLQDQPEPQQQVASADPGEFIKQHSVAATPPDEDPAPLMFAGMTGLQDVAALAARKSEAQPAPEQPAQVAALADSQFETTTTPVPQTSALKQERAVTEAVPADSAQQRERAESASVVDIDAMGADAMGADPMDSQPIREVSFRVSGVRADDMLNVRSGPSEFHEPIGRIPPAARGVKIVGHCRGEWCPIRRGRVSGWVNSYYLAEERTSARP